MHLFHAGNRQGRTEWPGTNSVNEAATGWQICAQVLIRGITHASGRQLISTLTGEQSSWLYYSIEITITWKLMVFFNFFQRTWLPSGLMSRIKSFALHTWREK